MVSSEHFVCPFLEKHKQQQNGQERNHAPPGKDSSHGVKLQFLDQFLGKDLSGDGGVGLPFGKFHHLSLEEIERRLLA